MNVEVLGNDELEGTMVDLRAIADAKRRMFRKMASSPRMLKHVPLAFRAASPSRIRKYAPLAFRTAYGSRIARNAMFGNDDMMGGLFSSIAKYGGKIIGGIGKFARSDAGKSMGTALMATAASRMTPTEKAQLAETQAALGMPYVPVTAGTPTNLYFPNQQGFDMQKNLPYIIAGGALLVGVVFMMATRRQRAV